jgi:DNA-binding beta-propeller fold protein YncE
MSTFRTLLAGAFVLVQLAFGAAAQTTLPPAPPQKIAVNALTNKVYTANYDADTVTVFNAATGTSVPIAVGDGPLFVAVNPATNRVYVNNSRAASLSVIDGATDTLIGTYAVGSTGPIAVNPVTNVIYVVRLTGTGTDEVTYFNGANNTWYTIAVQSHQPIAVATNPATNKIFVAAYSTGNVSIIDGTFNSNNDHPTPIKMGMWSKPFALAVNPVTNKVFVITEDSRGPIAVLDVNTLNTTFLLAGAARVPKAVAVNPVTNKAYALFSNELVVVDGSTLATTSIPVPDAGTALTAVATLGVNTATNRILVAAATGSLTVIDGSTNAVIDNGTVPTGTSGAAINAVTGTSYFFDTALHAVPRAAGEGTVANPVTTSITPLAGNSTGPDFAITFNAASSFAPNALPIRKVYYQLDTTTGPWTAASGTGPYTATFTGVAPGPHTVYAFAVEGQDAPLATGAYSAPLVGTMASYAFTVASPSVDPSVSLGSSSNPSTFGNQVTFTASVSGPNGTATGTVTFRDGSTALCSGVALASGSATCSTSALAVGTHDITAQYSGDVKYNPRTSGILQQQVQAAPPATRTLTVVKAGSGAGTVTSSPTGVACGSTCSAPFPSGSSVALTASAGEGSVFAGWSGACSGTAACNVTMDAAKSVTATFNLAPAANPARLVNLSTRNLVETGDNVLIGGFIIQGSTHKTVVVRARGPSMAPLGVSNTLADPQLQLFNGQTPIGFNNNWQEASNKDAIQASGQAPSHPNEAAILMTLPPGGYSAIVTGVGNTTGIAIVEVFEIDNVANPLVNISARGPVRTGDNVMIGGFIIQGDGPQTVLVRARGPSLTQYGVPGALANPQLQLFRGQTPIAYNDNWVDAPNKPAIEASPHAPEDPNESAILVTLEPGAYSAIVTGVGGATGIAIVEVFRN